jgi:hypothetical protein
MGVGAVALVATLLTLSAPKAVHAVVAALVQVTNTTANPVPVVSTDNPALQPFGTLLFADSPPNFSFTVPPGKTLVMEEFGVGCGVVSGTFYQTYFTLTVNNSTVSTSYNFVPTALNGQELILAQAVHIYADPGSTVEIGNGGGLPNGTSMECNASVSGHYVNTP